MEVKMTKPTLDYITATIAQKIVKIIGEPVKDKKTVEKDTLENLATKTLGVLQSQGIYAAALFLMTKLGDIKDIKDNNMSAEGRCASEILSWLHTLANTKTISNFEPDKYEPTIHYTQVPHKKDEILKNIASITSEDLEELLMVRTIWEQLLIYVRFHAKAAQKSPEE